MNRIYKHIWSKALGRLVVVPECARGAGGKAGRRRNRRAAAALLASTALAAPALAQDALPTGGQVVSGTATITTNGAAMTIDQSSERMIANWQGFSIGAGNSVTFNQPGASSVALNRVTGQDASQILGNLNANGQVFLVNPNGVAIGSTGRVQTGAFVASTLGITDGDFLADTYSFAGAGGTILNEGEIAGATVALIAPSVINAGTITGNTALAGGTDVLLDFDGDGLLSVEVRGSTLETLVENRGLIKADGGVAILTAKGASAAMKGVVNNSGTVEANTIGVKNGRILLLGDKQHGEVRAAGRLKAKDVETAAAKVKLDRNVKVETSGGRWLINPADVAIDADYAATLQDNLANGSITVSTANQGTGTGDIAVASAVTWNANTLELTADGDIAINAALKSTAGGLTLGAAGAITPGAAVNVGSFTLNSGDWAQAGATLPDFSAASFARYGGSFLRVVGGDGSLATPYLVADVYGLQGIGSSAAYLAANWTLAKDIDATGTENWERRFVPIGTQVGPAFTGRFDGGGHVISKLTASHPNYGGLFGLTSGATIENVGVRESIISSAGGAGGIVAWASDATVIRNVYSTATVRGWFYSGGLVGQALSGTTISNAYATSFQPNGVNLVGGLVGVLDGSTITNAFATGYMNVSSSGNQIAGLVGSISNSTVSSSYWDTETTNRANGIGSGGWSNTGTIAGLTTAQALQQASYAGFDFTNTWFMIEGHTRPFLRSEWQSVITNPHQLQLMAMKPGASYVLGGNVDFSNTFTSSFTSNRNMWGTSLSVGGGFSPVGDAAAPFTGTFDGRGYTISNLLIKRPTAVNVGLFGDIAGTSSVRNIGLVGGSVSGRSVVGALAGSSSGTLENVYAKTAVTRNGPDVGGYDGVGGLVGVNFGPVLNAYATGSVSDATLGNLAGGLIGLNYGGAVSNVYATGSVVGGYVGGLIGNNGGTLTNAYATGSLYATGAAGGLIGISEAVVNNVYASGAVNGEPSADLAGLVAINYGNVTNAFWNPETTGRGSTVGTALNSGGMGDPFQFIGAGWDFASTWAMRKAGGAPVLRSLTTDAVYDYYIRFAGGLSRGYGDTVSAAGIPLEGVGTGNVGVGWGSAITVATDVGTYRWSDGNVLSLSYTTGTAANYYVDYGVDGLSIVPRVVNLAASRVYDGTTSLASGVIAIGNLANGETLGLTGDGALADKNAGQDLDFSLGGLALVDGTGKASNYTLAGGSYKADIARATISSIAGITAVNRTYDGTTLAALSMASVSFTDLLAGDVLTVGSATGNFTDKNAGGGKTVNITGLTLSGTDAGNYILADNTVTTTADIARASISAITGIHGVGRVYDGTRVAGLDVSGAGFTGMVAGDTLTVASGTGAFVDKNAGTNKSVAISGLTLGGVDAGNYTLADATATTTADISRATIASITGITALNKTYDGTRAADIATGAAGFTGMVAGDMLTVASGTGTFADRNAGTGKRVDIAGLTLGGADAGNYVLADDTAMASADIARATISSVTGITGIDRLYDGTTVAGLNTTTAGFTGMVVGDALTVASATGVFADKNAQANKAVAVTGLTLGGVDAGNYTLADTTAATVADIDRATISAVSGLAGIDRVYDGRLAVGLDTTGAQFTGLVAGDALTVASATGAFLDKNAGAGKAIAVTGLSLGGADAGNYVLADTTATATADVTKAAISAVTGIDAVDRTYDGTRTATLSTGGAGFAGMIAGDVLTVANGAGTFADKNAGTGKTVAISGLTLGGVDAGNYVLADTTATTTADIARATILAVTGITAAGKTYDGTTAATLSTASAGFTGMIAGDALTVAAATGAFADRNAGSGKQVGISGLSLGGLDAGNYVLADSTATTTADIARAALTLTGFTAESRVYDGTTTARIATAGALSGVVLGDDIAFDFGGVTFSDRNAGTNKLVTMQNVALRGMDAGNYTIASIATTTADITRAAISAVTGITAAGKTYDGTRGATLSTGAAGFDGLIQGDTLTVASASGAFADKNAGMGKRVDITGLSLGGADAGNYWLADTTASTTADIARATIASISGITARDRIYDGTTVAMLSTASAGFAGMAAGDVLTVASGTGTFADRHVGTGKQVTVTGLSLGGVDAGNYTLADTTATTTADISRAALTLTGFAAANRTYDGTTVATVSNAGTLSGLFLGDDVQFSHGAAAFADKNAGTGKTVRLSGIALSGADAGNYALTGTMATTTADIARASISAITGIHGVGRLYDGTRVAGLDVSGAGFTGMVAGDTLTVASGTGAFVDKNAGTNKSVAISGLTLGGVDAGNYTLADATATTTADISRATIASITGITALNKTYDGTRAADIATGAAGFTGMVAGDMLTVASGTGTFADRNAGTGKRVDIAGLSLGGVDAGNYVLADDTAMASADIARATLTLAGFTAANRTYDGTTVATVSNAGTLSGVFLADDVRFSHGAAAFADKNAGTGKTVRLSGIALSGADAGNYTIAGTATASADIAKATISAVTGITATGKTYDGTVAAVLSTGSAGFTGLLAGDSLEVSAATGAFADRNAGAGKRVDVTGLILGGADAGNYTLADTTATATASISRATLTLSGFAVANRTYDGTVAAQISAAGTLSGVFFIDDVHLSHGAAAFADRNAGTNKVVTLDGVALSGVDAGNYTIAGTAVTTADIGRAGISAVTGILAADKLYDGTRVATLDLTVAGFAGLLSGDSLAVLAATGRFENAAPGRDKTVRITGLTLGGVDAANYVLLDDTAIATAAIDALFASPLPPQMLGARGASIFGFFFPLPSSRSVFAAPDMIDFSAWQPGAGDLNFEGFQ
ncbi:UNVERIFIED_ORG: YDG domain-containing protein (plasmid) [Roseateles sp. XES5]|nr:YDG domain-containing protein [Roseateles sp. XES5]